MNLNMTYLELYNGSIRDLLNPECFQQGRTNSTIYKIREKPGSIVKDITSIVEKSIESL